MLFCKSNVVFYVFHSFFSLQCSLRNRAAGCFFLSVRGFIRSDGGNKNNLGLWM